MDSLIKTLDDIFVGKAPALPEGAKEWIVKFGPWVTLVLIILFLPVLLLALGVSAFFSPFAATAGPGVVRGLAFAWIFVAVSLGLEVAALPGLFKRKTQGWKLLFYATLLSAVYNLFTFNWFGLIVGTLITLYILMQIRTKYS